MKRFGYLAPQSLAEALEMLSDRPGGRTSTNADGASPALRL